MEIKKMKIVIEIPVAQYVYLSKIADAGQEPLGYYERVIMRGVPLSKDYELEKLNEKSKYQNTWSLVMK